LERATVTLETEGPNGPTLDVYDDDDICMSDRIEVAYIRHFF
jgi:hypothetical protein